VRMAVTVVPAGRVPPVTVAPTWITPAEAAGTAVTVRTLPLFATAAGVKTPAGAVLADPSLMKPVRMMVAAVAPAVVGVQAVAPVDE